MIPTRRGGAAAVAAAAAAAAAAALAISAPALAASVPPASAFAPPLSRRPPARRRPVPRPRALDPPPPARSRWGGPPPPATSLSMISGPVARVAGLGTGRPLLSEDDVAEPPDGRVVEAVERGGGDEVIASDIAARAGVSLSLARRSLSTLATLTGGDISVTADGDLLYSFPRNVRSALASNSARYAALQTWEEKIWPKLFYGIRVGFGVLLFVSIFAIFSTVFFVAQGGGGSDRDRDDRRRDGGLGGGGGGGGYGMGNLMFDLFFPRPLFYSPYYGYYGRTPYSIRYYGGAPRRDEEEEGEDTPNIFERVFSYIFGDGDPNRGLETARLRAAARVIRESGGAVVAEQLAPFVDAPAPDPAYLEAGGAYADESFVLPIVSQLGGEPTVTEDGDIVYVFPELQLSAETTLDAAGLGPDASPREIAEVLNYRGVDTRGALEKADLIRMLDRSLSDSLVGRDMSEPVQEEELEFNRAGTGWNALSGALGLINLGGALYLGQVLSSPAMMGVRLPSYFGLVQSAYPLLLAYAVLFNVIPLVRNAYNSWVNSGIKERNDARRGWVNALRSAGGRVRRKLTAAARLSTGVRRVGGEGGDIVYDTRRDGASDLGKKKEEDAMRDFDRILNQDEGGSFQ